MSIERTEFIENEELAKEREYAKLYEATTKPSSAVVEGRSSWTILTAPSLERLSSIAAAIADRVTADQNTLDY